MTYRAHSYGGSAIEDTLDYFESLAGAIEFIEGKCSDDHDGWDFKDGKLRLVDYNNGKSVVINVVKEVDK